MEQSNGFRRDLTLVQYVLESIHKEEIRSLYESFCSGDENDPSITDDAESDDTFPYRDTIRGQKEKQKENEKEKQQQKAFQSKIEKHPDTDNVKEIIEFWDANGFGFSNVNAKQQLLAWLDDSSFLQPKEMILKAMNIACANNKRRLNYILGILKNWENESLLTVEEIDSY
ncbi:DnaD domain protein [Schinkia azotoformans]|uniref:DnaD domain protein n=1 Tax=Schinkia azotoformans TaxID=1454 RepID=UPI002DB95E0D|nr:DnaD domain protein [Schinkia azotoformans]MEC1714603.1 DnaD domain protein [Schinkia azotoformans]MEC1742946.1 DnaD domain protein [Schinkia azotoformans]MEC1745377.1 DnaD domain protein [Schinkia azotoformans]MEC1757076.1 DnaD domain protein [Schinkia azotoformans]MEC1768253.1 DnaD domain protein [Schinkia azotoformans]